MKYPTESSVCSSALIAASAEPRIRLVFRDVLADGAPHRLKHFRRSGEVNSREIGMMEQDIADRTRIARYEINHARWESRSFEQFEDVIVAEDSRTRRLPDDA